MTSTVETENGSGAPRSNWVMRALIDNLPFVAIIVIGLVGISWTSMTEQPTATYWLYVTPILALICIAEGWRNTPVGGRAAMVVTQIALWAAVLVGKYLITISDVQRVLNVNATGLMTLTLLALAVFLSGLTLRTWKLCVTGVFLGACVPVVAWVQNASVFLLFAGIVLIAVLIVYWWLRDRFAA